MFKFASQWISLCFTAVKITKTWQETRNFFGADFLFVFRTLWVLSWNIRIFLSLGGESSISRNLRNFLRAISFYISSSESYFLKCKRNIRLESSIFGNIRSCFSWNIRKCARQLFLQKRSIVDVWQSSKYALSSKYIRVLNMLIALNMAGFWIYLSRNIRKYRYASVLNIPFLKYKEFFRGFQFLKFKKVPFPRNIRKFRLLKYKKCPFHKI